MDRPVSPFIFTEYDKISDTLMWFGTSKYRLRFNVQLSRRDNNGNVRSFHSEFGFYNESMDKNFININSAEFHRLRKSRSGVQAGRKLVRHHLQKAFPENDPRRDAGPAPPLRRRVPPPDGADLRELAEG